MVDSTRSLHSGVITVLLGILVAQRVNWEAIEYLIRMADYEPTVSFEMLISRPEFAVTCFFSICSVSAILIGTYSFATSVHQSLESRN